MNKNLNFLRGMAVIIVVIYHIFAITGVNTRIEILDDFISLWGEIGVTIFFIISGYGIYTSIKKQNGKIAYIEFIKKRLQRILPQYYISLVVCLLLTSSIIYFSKEYIFNVISHFFLFHNLFTSTHGTINGVLWTMGTIFQFYLIAPLLYKLIEKRPKITLIISILFTVFLKYIIFNFIISKSSLENTLSYYWVYSRQIFTALDNFIIGMFLAKILYGFNFNYNKKQIIYIIISILMIIITILWVLVGLGKINIHITNNGIYSNCFLGYIWHTILACILGIFIFFFSKISMNKFIFEPINYISKYEYGIYIWHLLIINNMCQNLNYIKNLILLNSRIIYILLFIVSIISGIIITEIINNINFKKVYDSLKNVLKIFAMMIVICIIICLI